MIFESMPELSGRGYTSEGHWFCCPNGHVYTVGECGGAMETSQCPECSAVIGGSSHQLDSSNGIASSFLDLANAEIDFISTSTFHHFISTSIRKGSIW
jgi:hypothetical protein